MRRLALAALALAGCAAPPAHPTVVRLPAGLSSSSPAPRPPPEPETPRAEPIHGPGARPRIAAHAEAGSVRQMPTRERIEASKRVAAPVPVPVAAAPSVGYRLPGVGAEEVEAVCRWDAKTVECWDLKGKPREGFSDRVRGAMSIENGMSWPPQTYGVKNRILVVRHEQAPGASIGMRIERYGTKLDQDDGHTADLGPHDPPAPGNPYVVYRAAPVAEAPDARETRMRIRVTTPLKTSVDVPLREGASVAYAGCRFVVVSVGKRDPRRGGYFGGSPDRVWVAHLRRVGQPSHPTNFSVDNAEGAAYVDAAGKVVGQAPYMAYWKARSDEMRKTGKTFDVSRFPFERIFATGFGFARASEFDVTLNVEPRRVGKIRLRGATERTVDVGGIPLDPP